VLAKRRLACAIRERANGDLPSDIKETLGVVANLLPLQKRYSEIYRKRICFSDLLAQRRTRQTRSTAYKQMLDMASELRSEIQDLAPLLANVSDNTGCTVFARVRNRLPANSLPYEQHALLEGREYLMALG